MKIFTWPPYIYTAFRSFQCRSFIDLSLFSNLVIHKSCLRQRLHLCDICQSDMQGMLKTTKLVSGSCRLLACSKEVYKLLSDRNEEANDICLALSIVTALTHAHPDCEGIGGAMATRSNLSRI